MGAAPEPVHIVDPAKVRARRIEAGLAERELGSTLGLAVGVIRALERGGDQGYLNLRVVRDLARAIGTTPDDLLTDEPSTPASPAVPDAVEDGDVATVGAVLAEMQELVAVDTLAWSLRWTSARTLVALDRLEVELGAVGQRLRWLHDTMVGICAIRPDDTVLDAAASRSVAEEGIAPREASVLARMIERPQHRLRDIPIVTLRRFRRAGLIHTDVVDDPAERKAAGRNCEGARLTDLARYNLVLDIEATTEAALRRST